MGAVADRHGRWAALTVTILRMGGSSLLAGLTPAYATVGVPAPVILALARLLQGLSVGGEFAASTTFLVESAGPGRRGLFSRDSSTCRRRWGGWSPSGIATLLVGTLSDGQMNGWGRRVPLVLGAVLSPVGFWIRQGAQETRSAEQRQGPRPGLFEALRRYPRESLLIGGITAAARSRTARGRRTCRRTPNSTPASRSRTRCSRARSHCPSSPGCNRSAACSPSVALFGGTAPYVGTLFKEQGHAGLFPWYVAVICLVLSVVYPEAAGDGSRTAAAVR
jgi:MFS family permease